MITDAECAEFVAAECAEFVADLKAYAALHPSGVPLDAFVAVFMQPEMPPEIKSQLTTQMEGTFKSSGAVDGLLPAEAYVEVMGQFAEDGLGPGPLAGNLKRELAAKQQ